MMMWRMASLEMGLRMMIQPLREVPSLMKILQVRLLQVKRIRTNSTFLLSSHTNYLCEVIKSLLNKIRSYLTKLPESRMLLILHFCDADTQRTISTSFKVFKTSRTISFVINIKPVHFGFRRD